MTDPELGQKIGSIWAEEMDRQHQVMRGPDGEIIDAVALVAQGEIPPPVRDKIARIAETFSAIMGLGPAPDTMSFWEGVSEGARRYVDAQVAGQGRGRN